MFIVIINIKYGISKALFGLVSVSWTVMSCVTPSIGMMALTSISSMAVDASFSFISFDGPSTWP